MAWCYQATSHYLHQFWSRSGVIRPSELKICKLNEYREHATDFFYYETCCYPNIFNGLLYHPSWIPLYHAYKLSIWWIGNHTSCQHCIVVTLITCMNISHSVWTGGNISNQVPFYMIWNDKMIYIYVYIYDVFCFHTINWCVWTETIKIMFSECHIHSTCIFLPIYGLWNWSIYSMLYSSDPILAPCVD